MGAVVLCAVFVGSPGGAIGLARHVEVGLLHLHCGGPYGYSLVLYENF